MNGIVNILISILLYTYSKQVKELNKTTIQNFSNIADLIAQFTVKILFTLNI